MPEGAVSNVTSLLKHDNRYGKSHIVSEQLIKDENRGVRTKSLIAHYDNKINIPIFQSPLVLTTGLSKIELGFANKYSKDTTVTSIYEEEIKSRLDIKLTFNFPITKAEANTTAELKMKETVKHEINESYYYKTYYNGIIDKNLRPNEYWALELRKNFRLAYYVLYNEVYDTRTNEVQYYVPISYEYHLFPIRGELITNLNFDCYGNPLNLPLLNNTYFVVDFDLFR